MTEPALSDPTIARRAARYLLRHGLATYAEVAALAGVSRQAARQQGVKLGAEQARARYLAKVWQKALANAAANAKASAKASASAQKPTASSTP